MDEYIKREEAIRVLCDACGNAACPKGLIPRCSFYERMQSIPAADVVERKRGKWKRRIVDNGFNADWKCSECGYKVMSDFFDFNFCPNCGARMNDESDDYKRTVEQMEYDMLYEPTYNPKDGSM